MPLEGAAVAPRFARAFQFPACPRQVCFVALRFAPRSTNASPHGYAGAGEGNRTLVVSLGSFCSAIELHPLGAASDCHGHAWPVNRLAGASFEVGDEVVRILEPDVQAD